MTTNERAGESIKSVQRALDILLCLAREADLGPTALGHRLGVHKSTAYRLLRTMEAQGFTYRDESTETWRLGPAALRLASEHAARPNIAAMARHTLVRLRDRTGETAVVDVRIGAERVCVAQVEAEHEIRRTQRVGVPMPLYAGAMGKVLLMEETHEGLEAIVARRGLDPLTPNTPRSLDTLISQVRRLHRDGFFVSEGERVTGATTVAVPVRSSQDVLVAALAVTGPSFRFGRVQARELAPLLQQSARAMGQRL